MSRETYYIYGPEEAASLGAYIGSHSLSRSVFTLSPSSLHALIDRRHVSARDQVLTQWRAAVTTITEDEVFSKRARSFIRSFSSANESLHHGNVRGSSIAIDSTKGINFQLMQSKAVPLVGLLGYDVATMISDVLQSLLSLPTEALESPPLIVPAEGGAAGEEETIEAGGRSALTVDTGSTFICTLWLSFLQSIQAGATDADEMDTCRLLATVLRMAGLDLLARTAPSSSSSGLTSKRHLSLCTKLARVVFVNSDHLASTSRSLSSLTAAFKCMVKASAAAAPCWAMTPPTCLPPSVVLVAKYPISGSSKTRLAPLLGTDGAAAFALASLLDLLHKFSSLCANRVLLFAPSDARDLFQSLLCKEGLDSLWDLVPMNSTRSDLTSTDLGGKLAAALEHCTETYFGATVFIGMDSPTLPFQALLAAATTAGDGTAVIHGAYDGGYTLLAVPPLSPAAVFRNITWSSTCTLTTQVASLQHCGLTVSVRECFDDIDEPQDIVKLYKSLVSDQAEGRGGGGLVSDQAEGRGGDGAHLSLDAPRVTAFLRDNSYRFTTAEGK